MKIQSKLIFNTKLVAAHKNVDTLAKGQASMLVGSALPNVLRIPAGSTVELADAEWEQFEKAAALHIKKGSLVLLQAPKLSEEAQAESDAARMAELEAEAKVIKERVAKAKKAPAKKEV